jgi:glycosyltransferase involved in cell wall biosynthesis
LQSVLDQTYRNIEVVIVDDGSSDGTVEIIEEFASADKRVRFYKNEERLNLNKNFEKAMRLCQGEYVCPCDQDDIWIENKLELLLQNMDSCNLSYSNSSYIDSEGNPLGRNLRDDYVNQNFDDPINFLFANAIPGHTMMLRYKVVQSAIPFPETVFYDHWLAFVALVDGKIKYIPQTLQLYRQHNANTVGAKGVVKRNKIKKPHNQSIVESIINLELKLKCLKCGTPEYDLVNNLLYTYRFNDLIGRIKRVVVFLKNRERLLLINRKSAIKKMFYCFKMYNKIIGFCPTLLNKS